MEPVGSAPAAPPMLKVVSASRSSLLLSEVVEASLEESLPLSLPLPSPDSRALRLFCDAPPFIPMTSNGDRVNTMVGEELGVLNRVFYSPGRYIREGVLQAIRPGNAVSGQRMRLLGRNDPNEPKYERRVLRESGRNPICDLKREPCSVFPASSIPVCAMIRHRRQKLV